MLMKFRLVSRNNHEDGDPPPSTRVLVGISHTAQKVTIIKRRTGISVTGTLIT